jgi:hypothetical protein
MIARANLPSRDLANQPLLKLNVGQGNSFIVKNSNIVITQNTINKAILNPTQPMVGGTTTIPIIG